MFVSVGLFAQEQQAAILPVVPPPGQAYSQVKAQLGLTDAQVKSLEEIARSRQEADRANWQRMAEKEREMFQLLESGSTDAGRIGALMIELNRMRRQSPSTEQYRKAAVAVLTPEQLPKLAVLANVLQLQGAAHEAIGLNLLDYPAPGLPIPFTR